MNLTIKNIPENIYQTLKQKAAREGRSLNAQVIQALSMDVHEEYRKEEMRRSWNDLQRFVARQKPGPDSVPSIRADRKRR